MTTSHQHFIAAQQHIPGGVNSPVRAFKGVLTQRSLKRCKTPPQMAYD